MRCVWVERAIHVSRVLLSCHLRLACCPARLAADICPQGSLTVKCTAGVRLGKKGARFEEQGSRGDERGSRGMCAVHR